MNSFQHMALDQLEPDPAQPRQHVDDEKLAELAASIRIHGIIVPLGVRPHPNKNHGAHMIVKGERRWRAAAIAGLTEVPVIVEDLTDQQALEHQLIENSQREDVHPLDEADAYQRLLDQVGMSMEDLVAKSGKSKAHLYGRLKLLDLAPAAREAFVSGKLAATVAELIARIPSQQLQAAATKDVLGLGEWKDYEGSSVQPESIGEGRASDAEAQPLSFRAARALIHKKYNLKLELAKFSTQDADLVPAAGACTTCVHRSGNQPELALPGVEKTADDLCTNPPCFESKTQAAWKRAAADAKARGLDIVEGKKAEAIFVWNGDVQSSSPYVDVDTKLPYDLDPTGASGKTFGKLLGKLAAEIPRVLVQGPSGEPRELMVKAKAVEALREAGKLEKPATSKPGPKASTRADKEAEAKRRAKDQEKELLNEQALRQVLAKVAAFAEDPPEKKELATWKWMARVILDGQGFSSEDEGAMLHRRGLDKTDDLLAAVEKARTVADVRSVVIEWLMTCVTGAKTGGFATKQTKDLFDDACRLFAVDWAEQVDIARDAMKAVAKKADEDKAEAKAKKKAGGK